MRAAAAERDRRGTEQQAAQQGASIAGRCIGPAPVPDRCPVELDPQVVAGAGRRDAGRGAARWTARRRCRATRPAGAPPGRWHGRGWRRRRWSVPRRAGRPARRAGSGRAPAGCGRARPCISQATSIVLGGAGRRAVDGPLDPPLPRPIHPILLLEAHERRCRAWRDRGDARSSGRRGPPHDHDHRQLLQPSRVDLHRLALPPCGARAPRDWLSST